MSPETSPTAYPPSVPPVDDASRLADPAPARTGMVRIGAAVLLGTVAWASTFAASMSVLLPQRIALLAPDDKVTLLARLTMIIAVLGLLGTVFFGTVSDRTRTRWGSRTPWILAGALGAACFMIGLSRAESFASILLWWGAAIFCLNATTAGLAAIIPDRVPFRRRATISALQGIGILLGHALGTVIASLFLKDTATGTLVMAGMLVVLVTVALLLAPDHPSTQVAHEVAPAREAFRLPRKAPDFYWAFWGRLLLVLGYFMVNGFQLYILTDHIGLADDRAAKVLAVNSIIFLAGALLSAGISGPVSDRTGRRKTFVIGASVLAAVAVSIPLLIPTVAGMTTFSVIGGLAFGAYYAVDAALMADVLPNASSNARDLGILDVANTAGQVLAPAASSTIVGIAAGFNPVFVVAAASCLAGALLIRPIRGVR